MSPHATVWRRQAATGTDLLVFAALAFASDALVFVPILIACHYIQGLCCDGAMGEAGGMAASLWAPGLAYMFLAVVASVAYLDVPILPNGLVALLTNLHGVLIVASPFMAFRLFGKSVPAAFRLSVSLAVLGTRVFQQNMDRWILGM